MRNTKKVLVPLATLLAAGAIAVGSGATFTSTSSNTISAVTSGTLSQSNSKAGQAIFNLTDIKPGDVVNGSLAITNTGSLPANFSLTEVSSTNGFSAENLKLVITNTTTGSEVFKGTFGALEDGKKNVLGTFAKGATNTFTFKVSLDQDADNSQQGKAAGATYAWDAVQLTGETTDQ
ncbi:TasA family protein [Nocardioides campestrisoli]|uniref:TasA family protein n=1 Tax=Nocardioides campestrisoli TaxID=2736757 RepID=UPI00163DE48C|nr:TasA family protein [Nocardioides campestrisoli]